MQGNESKEIFLHALVEDLTPTGNVCVLPINPAAGNVTSKVSHLAAVPAPCGAGMGTAMCLLCPPESAAPTHIWSSWLLTRKDVVPYEQYFSCHLLLTTSLL